MPLEAFSNLLPDNLLADTKETITQRARFLGQTAEKAKEVMVKTVQNYTIMAPTYHQGTVTYTTYTP